MHVAGRLNTAADFIPRLELTPKERVEFIIRDDICSPRRQTKMQSTNIAEEEHQVFVT